MKKLISTVVTLVTACLLLTSCTVNLQGKKQIDEEYSSEEKYDVLDKGPVKGGLVRLFTTPIDTLNPVLTNNAYVQDFLNLVFEGLYVLDETQKVKPLLVENSSLSPDKLTLTLYLRKDVKWHDKMPFKAEDVVFTINTILDAKNGSIYSENVRMIQSVSALDSSTVQIILKQPFAFIKEQLTFPIIPAHYFLNEKISDKTMQRNMAPIGTGPYSFVAYNAKSGVKLKANDDWWGSKLQASDSFLSSMSAIEGPYIPNIEVKVYSDINQANNAFQARDIDVLPADYGEFRKYIGRQDISMKRYTGRKFEFLALNNKKGILADKRLRQAINYCLDKNQLVDSVASGIAIPSEIPITPGSWIYGLQQYERKADLKKSAELMKESGYILDKNGKYVSKSTRRPLTLSILVNDDNILRLNAATEIAAQLSKFGITVEVKRVPYDDLQKSISTKTYDMAMLGYSISSVPDLSFAYSSAQIQTGLNAAGYSNPQADSYLNLILTESGTELQKSYYTNLLGIIKDDTPFVGLFFLYDSVMYSKNLRGAMNPYTWKVYNNAAQWYMP